MAKNSSQSFVTVKAYIKKSHEDAEKLLKYTLAFETDQFFIV